MMTPIEHDCDCHHAEEDDDSEKSGINQADPGKQT
jgi:hypothetical protein